MQSAEFRGQCLINEVCLDQNMEVMRIAERTVMDTYVNASVEKTISEFFSCVYQIEVDKLVNTLSLGSHWCVQSTAWDSHRNCTAFF